MVLDGTSMNCADVNAYTLPFGGFLLLRTTNAPAEAEARVLLLQGP